MSLLKRVIYMGFGALLVLGLVIGGVVVFAQSGDDDGESAVAQDEDQDSETGDEAQGDDEAEDGLEPDLRTWRFRARAALGDDRQELLAEALGISVEELQAAYEEVRLAVIDQALEEDLITEEQAELLRESERPFRHGRIVRGLVINTDELLAEALGISVEELQEAREEVRVARLEALVEAGVLTQEQADMIAAREAVTDYIDQEALAATIQDAYEAAVEAALEDGAITQEQADQLLENLPSFGPFGFGGRGFHGRGHGPRWGGAFDSGSGDVAPAIDAVFDA